MAKLEILVQGYVTKDGQGDRASSSAVLVQDKETNIIVDPGVAKEELGNALKRLNLQPDNINYVLLTHYHPDHAFGAAWFPKAKILDNEEIMEGDIINKHDGFIPDTELAIMHTPGHAQEHCSLTVPTDKGMVVVAGDVFWWTGNEEQNIDINKTDPYALDHKVLVESREKVLKLADFVVPGHGKIFKVK